MQGLSFCHCVEQEHYVKAMTGLTMLSLSSYCFVILLILIKRTLKYSFPMRCQIPKQIDKGVPKVSMNLLNINVK